MRTPNPFHPEVKQLKPNAEKMAKHTRTPLVIFYIVAPAYSAHRRTTPSGPGMVQTHWRYRQW